MDPYEDPRDEVVKFECSVTNRKGEVVASISITGAVPTIVPVITAWWEEISTGRYRTVTR